MSGSGKSGNNRRNRHRFSGRRDDGYKHDKKHSENPVSDAKFEKNKQDKSERLLWTAPVLPANPIATPDCPWCGKKINDISSAMTDKETGLPVHFDCVLSRINGTEKLDANDSVCYIGGGRFGVIHYNNPPDTRDFSIKKILEWEVKDSVNEWRRPISEYFSIT